jgi:tRNA(Ile)-lysidine synthase
LWLPSDIKGKFLAGIESCGLRQMDSGAGGDKGAGAIRIGVAVSGGPDSIALLLLMHECYNGQIAAATVDHQLRTASAAEAQFVADLCADRKIPHYILTPRRAITGNIQSSARHTRYALLEKWADDHDCAYIATAHHADDQLETMLMRLARGSGVDGLSGVRRTNGRIIRPLLDFTKAELVAVCERAGIIPVQDPSNADTDFDRVRMRTWLAAMPNPLHVSAAARSASALADASAALDWMTAMLAADRIGQQDDWITLRPGDLPRELQRRLLLRCLAQIEPETRHRGEAISRGLDSLLAGRTITLGNTYCKGGPIWKFRPAPSRSGAKTGPD